MYEKDEPIVLWSFEGTDTHDVITESEFLDALAALLAEWTSPEEDAAYSDL